MCVCTRCARRVCVTADQFVLHNFSSQSAQAASAVNFTLIVFLSEQKPHPASSQSPPSSPPPPAIFAPHIVLSPFHLDWEGPLLNAYLQVSIILSLTHLKLFSPETVCFVLLLRYLNLLQATCQKVWFYSLLSLTDLVQQWNHSQRGFASVLQISLKSGASWEKNTLGAFQENPIKEHSCQRTSHKESKSDIKLILSGGDNFEIA